MIRRLGTVAALATAGLIAAPASPTSAAGSCKKAKAALVAYIASSLEPGLTLARGPRRQIRRLQERLLLSPPISETPARGLDRHRSVGIQQPDRATRCFRRRPRRRGVHRVDLRR